MTRPGFPPALTNRGARTASSILGALYHSDFAANDPAIVLNAGNVSSLPNRGLDGAAAVQGTAANQPAFGAASFNSGAGMTFDGVNDSLTATANTPFAIGKNPYLWIVFQRVAGAGPGPAATISANGVAPWLIAYAVLTGNMAATLNDGTAGDNGHSTGVAADTSRHLMELGFTGGTAAIVLDGVAINSIVTGPLASSITKIDIGALVGQGQFGNVVIPRMIVASDSMSASQKSSMRAYLRGANFPGYAGNAYGVP